MCAPRGIFRRSATQRRDVLALKIVQSPETCPVSTGGEGRGGGGGGGKKKKPACASQTPVPIVSPTALSEASAR